MNTLSKLLFTLSAAAALSFACPAKANLITNPGFETGDFTGWSTSGTASVLSGQVGFFFPHSGNFQAVFGSASLDQHITTTPGASYTIDFWVAHEGPGSINSLDVIWGGAPHILTLTNLGNVGYTEHTFTETATGFGDLEFVFVDPTGRWLLDDVSVTPVGVGVPDGGSTVSLLGCALLGLAALRRFLMG